MDMDRLPVNDCSTSGCATIQDATHTAHSTCHGNRAKVRSKAQKITIDAKDGSILRVTQLRSSLGNRIEHGLEVRRRASDHPEDVAGGGLAFE
jgi:hypothetical protein